MQKKKKKNALSVISCLLGLGTARNYIGNHWHSTGSGLDRLVESNNQTDFTCPWV